MKLVETWNAARADSSQGELTYRAWGGMNSEWMLHPPIGVKDLKGASSHA